MKGKKEQGNPADMPVRNSAVVSILTLILVLLFPTWLIFWALNLLGHRVSPRSRVRFSILWLKGRLILEEGAVIGNFNVLRIHHLRIGKRGYLGRFNNCRGPLSIDLDERAAIGNGNKLYRAPLGITYGHAVVRLGILSKVTGNHRLDCTRNIIFGDYCTLAGHDSQIWTHAYHGEETGPGRYRLDGDVVIGNNVYVGSRSMLNAGISICDAVTVGSGSIVSKSLHEPGVYVSQGLRFLGERNADRMTGLSRITGYDLAEPVYERKQPG